MQLLEINIAYRVIIGISAMVLLFASFLVVFINNQRKKLQYHKDLQSLYEQQKQILTEQNRLLEQRVQERTSDLSQQKEALQNSLKELSAAQAQLVQREKMASLGELMGGIAHEIQNPLNFVNNFSETNVELLAELKQEISNGNMEQVTAIASDVVDNQLKINQHGKRAESIVKSMLEHSRASKGEKQPTDINALTDEFLRLAYHGLLAKDKSFNATIQTDFDAQIGILQLVPQEIGRVLLNLFNNAFYAVGEKARKAPEAFEPTVTVRTKKCNDKIEIVVSDNGGGIPEQVVKKVFQPFFTTKPPGQGTGLGLSLSYDIVKSHGGEIIVESKESEGTAFTIRLPIVA